MSLFDEEIASLVKLRQFGEHRVNVFLDHLKILEDLLGAIGGLNERSVVVKRKILCLLQNLSPLLSQPTVTITVYGLGAFNVHVSSVIINLSSLTLKH